MRMVQMAIDEIIDMVPMRNRGVPALRTVNVIVRVSAAMMVGRAIARIGPTHGQFVFFHLAVGQLMVQMPVVEIADMALMFNGRVTAV
jgi:hypothetical protein